MKKLLKIFGIFFILVIAALVALPIIFKDDIKKMVDQSIDEYINGEVYFDANSFSVGIFKNFPDLTVSMNNFGVVGAGIYEGDTLASVNQFAAAIDIMSVLGSSDTKISYITLDGAKINGIVNEDGVANYLDILIDTGEEEEVTSEEHVEFAFSGKWQIINSSVKYSDHSTKMFAEIENIDHKGEGDFTQDLFDLVADTKLSGVSFQMDGADYLNKGAFDADMTMSMDMANSKYTFKENSFRLNDFAFDVHGWLGMNADESMDMDLKVKSTETEFKNILSLIPGVFMEGFEDIKTEGKLSFDALVQGKYDTTSMPGFKVNLLVDDAMFKYPDLPSAVENIAVDLKVVSTQDKMEEMLVDLKKLHLDMGSNPVDLVSKIKMLGSFEKMRVLANADAKVDLAQVKNFYPIEGLELKGLYELHSKADGVYDLNNNQFPSSNSTMTLTNGFVKSAEFPATIENINLDASVINKDGALPNTHVGLNKMTMVMEGEPIEMNATIDDLEKILFDINVVGKIDLDKLTQIYPLEGMNLAGLVDMDIHTKGSMEDIEAENYTAIAASGQASFTNFSYSDNEYMQNGFKMTDALVQFTPDHLEIARMKGFLGNSDLDVKGSLSNHMNYAFKEGELLKGNMTLISNTFDVDEWMVEEEGAEVEAGEEEPLEVIELPKNIDFMMASTINNVKYDDMGITNLKGDVTMKDGTACFKNTSFKCIGGDFLTNGCYDPSDMKNPKFDFDMDIKKASIADAYSTFNTVRAFAPIASIMEGSFSTNFKLDGPLDQELFPVLKALTGSGNIAIFGAKLKNVAQSVANPSGFDDEDPIFLAQLDNETKASNAIKNSLQNRTKGDGGKAILNLLGKLQDLTGLNLFNEQFSNTVFDAEIKKGRLFLSPFDTKLGKSLLNVSGSNGVDGSLDYLMKMDVPSGSVGKKALDKLSNSTGIPINSERIKFDVLLAGLMNNPDMKVGKPNAKDMAKDMLKDAILGKKDSTKNNVLQKKDDAVQGAKDDVKAKADKILADAKKAADAARNTAKTSAERVRKEGYAGADKIEKSSNNPLKKAANKVLADKARKEADRKADGIIKEGNAKADGIMATAQKKVDALYNK